MNPWPTPLIPGIERIVLVVFYGRKDEREYLRSGVYRRSTLRGHRGFFR